MPPATCWMSIDPGLTGTGWALWRGHSIEASGSVSASRRLDDWHDRAMDIGETVAQIAAANTVARMYYELPQFIQGRYEVNASGDLVKLCIVAGVIAGRLHRAHVKPIRIVDWKGQLSKEKTKERVAQILLGVMPGGYRLSSTTTHEVDAVGIGLYIIGEF